MNANAKAWVKALRSGKYKQAKGQLRVHNRFCCLGVACEQYKRKHKGWSYEPDDGGLPDEVVEWLGMEDTLGAFGQANLAEFNDTGMTFPEIADVIESAPDGLFS